MSAEQTLLALDRWLHNNRMEYYDQLLPGLTESELDGFEDRLGVRLPDSFRAFYLWHNGEASYEFGDEGILGESVRFFPMEEICELKQRLSVEERSRSSTEPTDKRSIDTIWKPDWVPFYESPGTYFCVDMTGQFEGIEGQIVRFRQSDFQNDSICIQSPSFDSFLRALMVALEEMTEDFHIMDRMNKGPELLWNNDPKHPEYPRFFPSQD